MPNDMKQNTEPRRRGRPTIGERPMTNSERNKAYRDRIAGNANTAQELLRQTVDYIEQIKINERDRETIINSLELIAANLIRIRSSP